MADIKFGSPSREFYLHWANTKSRDFMWAGTIVTFPPVNSVGPDPVYYDDGDPIPGTVVIRDIWGELDLESGEQRLVYNAESAVRAALGLPPIGSKAPVDFRKANSPLARAGLSVLHVKPSKREIHDLIQDKQVTVDRYEFDRSNEIIDAWDSKNARRKAAGMEPVNGDFEYQQAKIYVETYNNRLRDLYKRDVQEAPIGDDELQFAIWAKAQLLEQAAQMKDIAEDLKLKAVEAALEDPKTRLRLRATYQIRKRGHMEPSKEELESKTEE